MNRYLSLPAWMAIFAVCIGGCHKSTTETAALPPPAIVKAAIEKVVLQTVQTTEEAAGTVRSKASATIQSKLMGHIRAIHVNEGLPVTAGMLLIEIDDREATAQVKKAESGLLEAQSALQEVEKGIGGAQAARDAAVANQNLANATLERLKGLAQNEAISRQAYDEAEAKQKAAAAAYNQADQMLKSFDAKRAEAAARIERAQAELANAQIMLGCARIVSPMDGIVTRKYAEVGDLASPGMPLLEIEDNQSYRLEANVDESRVGLFHAGDTISVLVDALGSEPIAGTVAEVAPSSDPGSHTFVVKVALPPAPNLHSGLFGRVRYVSGEKKALTVPATAVAERGQLTGVFVVGDDRLARLRLVKTGKRYGERIEVLSGLSEGETIVADHTGAVQDGVRIES